VTDDPDIDLTDDLIDAAMLRAEKAVCPPGDARCSDFCHGAAYAKTHITPSGWAHIGWVAADSGRKTWDAWFNVKTGEGRLRKQEDKR
jgi:hypothetical protein